MLYILSLLGIILEISLPFNMNILIITLSFLVYLIALKGEKDIIWIGVISLILSLQTEDFFRIVIILLISYYVLNFLFLHLSYEKGNILILSIIQCIIYIILSWNNFNIRYLIINLIGFIILDYIYMRILRKKDRGIEG